MIKNLRSSSDATQASTLLNDVKALLDRLASKGIIHKNAAANKKSRLEKFVKSLS